MFCIKCGAQLPDESKFCYKCGCDLSSVNSESQTPPRQASGNAHTNYQPFDPVPMSNKELLRQAEASFGMKWFKFLIYFSLFLAAIVCFVTGAMQMTGTVYDGMATAVYSSFPSLEMLDIIIGAATIVCGVIILVSRFRLAAFKKGSANILIAGYALNLIVNLAYTAAAISIIGSSNLDLSSFGASMAGSVIMLIINRTYLAKRESLFIH